MLNLAVNLPLPWLFELILQLCCISLLIGILQQWCITHLSSCNLSNTIVLLYVKVAHNCVLFLTPHHGFSCRDSNPLRDVFTVQRPAGVATVTATDLKTTDQEEKQEYNNGEVTVIYSEEAGTQIIQHQDSLTDYCSISSDCCPELLGSDCSSSTTPGSLTSHSSMPLPAGQEEMGRDQDQQASTNPESYLDSTDTVNSTLPQLQAFTVLPVNGTLWIPRYKMLHTNWTQHKDSS